MPTPAEIDIFDIAYIPKYRMFHSTSKDAEEKKWLLYGYMHHGIIVKGLTKKVLFKPCQGKLYVKDWLLLETGIESTATWIFNGINDDLEYFIVFHGYGH